MYKSCLLKKKKLKKKKKKKKGKKGNHLDISFDFF